MRYKVETDFCGSIPTSSWIELYVEPKEYMEIKQKLGKKRDDLIFLGKFAIPTIFINKFMDFKKIEQIISDEEIKKTLYIGFMEHFSGVYVRLEGYCL